MSDRYAIAVDEDTCRQMIWPHICRLDNCPKDDPDHVHMCYADDFDWTEGEFQSYRLGRITIEELLEAAFRRTLHRGYSKTDNVYYEPQVQDQVRRWQRAVRYNETAGVQIKADKGGVYFVREDGSRPDPGELVEP